MSKFINCNNTTYALRMKYRSARSITMDPLPNEPFRNDIDGKFIRPESLFITCYNKQNCEIYSEAFGNIHRNKTIINETGDVLPIDQLYELFNTFNENDTTNSNKINININHLPDDVLSLQIKLIKQDDTANDTLCNIILIKTYMTNIQKTNLYNIFKYKEKDDIIKEKDKIIKEKDKIIKEKDNIITEKDKIIAELTKK